MGVGLADNPQATEGDVFYFSAYARKAGAGTSQDVSVTFIWFDEDETNISSSTGSTVTTSSTFKLVEHSATAPAGTAYVAFSVNVANVGDATAVHWDDLYARRKVGTLIIEDQAVDIERLLDPIHQDGGNNSVGNSTVNTTQSEATSVTLSIPSWVGVLNSILVGGLQMTEASAERLVTLVPIIAGTTGDTVNQEISNAGITETITFSVQQHRGIVSPGSSVKWSLESKVSTGSNTTNQHGLSVLTTGER